MANTIQHKRSSTASDVPTSSDLLVGEIAVNTADGKIYTKHTNGSIVELGGATGALLAANNLSDLNNAATARSNLDVDQAGTAVALAIALG